MVGLCLILSSGPACMVMDELDTAAAKLPANGKQKSGAGKKEGAKLTAAERLAAAKSASVARSKQWWSEAKTMTPGETPAGIVSCRLPEGMKFMSQDDCIVQGGRPDSSS